MRTARSLPLQSTISVSKLTKLFASGFCALRSVDLEIRRGEIFALLGPNGAGKTTLINIICGLTNPTYGTVTINGHDIIRDSRAARSTIGLVPQELAVDMFQTVWSGVKFSRALFGKPANPKYLEGVLRELSLWEKRDCETVMLSGGMKRRLMIAKALAHEPKILFLDEPTAGVDVELRHAMWEMMRSLKQEDVTIILTTHYIEEAEAMADRIGLISSGEIILVEETAALLEKRGTKTLTLHLQTPLPGIPATLKTGQVELSPDGSQLTYLFDIESKRAGVGGMLNRLGEHGIRFKDLEIKKSSLEEILVALIRSRP